ncbi:MAG TPA: hypothetical protein PKC30_03555 [Saprospiraceae bacterium]|nr:hypothetical protein [Saprospiraceae bacterium]
MFLLAYPIFIKSAFNTTLNALGKKIPMKVVAFESDDWGSVRMPSKEFCNIYQKWYNSEASPYALYDSIATDDDLTCLFSVLHQYTDALGNSPIFTFNFIMANPAFQRIKDSDFREYFYEPFYLTLSNYSHTGQYIDLIKEGIERKVIHSELHGREHVHIKRWLSLLQSKNAASLEAFNHNTYMFQPQKPHLKSKSLFAALDFDSTEELGGHRQILYDARDLFRDTFHRAPGSFIAPNYVWNKNHESMLNEIGIQSVQGTKFQNIPKHGSSHYKKSLRLMGNNNKHRQVQLVRNCFFEPSHSRRKDEVNACLREIDRAFRCKVPAIISSHRLHYIGRLDIKNRDRNLQMLKTLLREINRNWPDVLYFNSSELAKLYMA